MDDSDVWTAEQTEALKAAYHTTPPDESFWRVVARSVPGKSAMQCACKYQEGLADAPAEAPAKAGKPAGKGRAAKGSAGSPGGARAALEAAALGKRGRSAREQSLRAAGREVRRKRREADAGYADDAFEEPLPQAQPEGAARAPSALQASLAAAAAATGTAALLVPRQPAAAAPRRDARQTEAYVEQTLRRSRPKAVPAPAAPPPAAAAKAAPAPKGGVRALIDSIAASAKAPAAARVVEEEDDDLDSEDRDDYFSDD